MNYSTASKTTQNLGNHTSLTVVTVKFQVSTDFNISLSGKHRILKLFTCTTISRHLKQISRVASNPLKWSNIQDPVLSTADSHGMELV